MISALAEGGEHRLAESVAVPNQVVLISPASTSALLTRLEDGLRLETPDTIQASCWSF
jgi:hypothetical protein